MSSIKRGNWKRLFKCRCLSIANPSEEDVLRNIRQQLRSISHPSLDVITQAKELFGESIEDTYEDSYRKAIKRTNKRVPNRSRSLDDWETAVEYRADNRPASISNQNENRIEREHDYQRLENYATFHQPRRRLPEVHISESREKVLRPGEVKPYRDPNAHSAERACPQQTTSGHALPPIVHVECHVRPKNIKRSKSAQDSGPQSQTLPRRVSHTPRDTDLVSPPRGNRPQDPDKVAAGRVSRTTLSTDYNSSEQRPLSKLSPANELLREKTITEVPPDHKQTTARPKQTSDHRPICKDCRPKVNPNSKQLTKGSSLDSNYKNPEAGLEQSQDYKLTYKGCCPKVNPNSKQLTKDSFLNSYHKNPKACLKQSQDHKPIYKGGCPKAYLNSNQLSKDSTLFPNSKTLKVHPKQSPDCEANYYGDCPKVYLDSNQLIRDLNLLSKPKITGVRTKHSPDRKTIYKDCHPRDHQDSSIRQPLSAPLPLSKWNNKKISPENVQPIPNDHIYTEILSPGYVAPNPVSFPCKPDRPSATVTGQHTNSLRDSTYYNLRAIRYSVPVSNNLSKTLESRLSRTPDYVNLVYGKRTTQPFNSIAPSKLGYSSQVPGYITPIQIKPSNPSFGYSFPNCESLLNLLPNTIPIYTNLASCFSSRIIKNPENIFTTQVGLSSQHPNHTALNYGHTTSTDRHQYAGFNTATYAREEHNCPYKAILLRTSLCSRDEKGIQTDKVDENFVRLSPPPPAPNTPEPVVERQSSAEETLTRDIPSLEPETEAPRDVVDYPLFISPDSLDSFLNIKFEIECLMEEYPLRLDGDEGAQPPRSPSPELPQYGHKQWHSYFGRTFDVYSKLWKFQQQHRAVLDTKYGLKRWQIGEIASKIGQLYYHFYLRTSETAYLNEAFSFYYAIRGRSYYTKACKEDKCELMVKKLRYYTRFIVCCLLLKKVKLVKELIKELDRQIIEYGNTYDPDDQLEWTVVVDEVKAFIQAESVVSVIHPDSYPVVVSHRLNHMTAPPIERTTQMSLILQEVLIVGSSSQQVKFSELTMDMYRMIQTLEREPTGDIHHMYDESPQQRFVTTPNAPPKGYARRSVSSNPHKYLLYKPSPIQLIVYLSSGCNDLVSNGALLLYVSGDAQSPHSSHHTEDAGYNLGGVPTTSKIDIHVESNRDSRATRHKNIQCLYPGDLYSFTRRPLFIILDSDSSTSFENTPRYFGKPVIILMSPVELPPSFQERQQDGRLFTLFLHAPMTAFFYCCEMYTVPLVLWDRALDYLDIFLTTALNIFLRGKTDAAFRPFLGDDYLRVITLRYMFCDLTMRLHRSFRGPNQRPRTSPPIPDDVIQHPELINILMNLANELKVREYFRDAPASLGVQDYPE